MTERLREQVAATAAWILCGSITMLFVGLTSAMVVRRGMAGDWEGVPLPPAIWVNTSLLIISSLVLHVGWRRSAWILGLIFLAGQAWVWTQLPTAQPGDWFLWVFSVTHALHVIGGIIALNYARESAAKIYWHFLTGLWIYLMLLFAIWGRE
jgi:cytochrome c oxidase subunit 3